MASYQVLYTPRDKLIAAAKANGWTEQSGDSLLDAVGDHYSFEEVDSEYRTLDEAVARAKRLVVEERDFFGVTSVEELERQLVVPADNYYEWVPVTRYNVDETGIIETHRVEAA